MYEIHLRASAVQDLKGLEPLTERRVLDCVRKLAKNPRGRQCHELATTNARWRVRVGDYRILYEIDDVRNTVTVFRVAHRREVYR